MTTRGPGTAESERVYVAQGRAATVCCQLDQVSTEQRFRWSLHIGTGQINNYLPPAKSVRSALVTMPCQEQQLQRGLTHIFSKPYSLRPAHLFPGKLMGCARNITPDLPARRHPAFGLCPGRERTLQAFHLALPTVTTLTPQVNVAILPAITSISMTYSGTGKITTEGPVDPSRQTLPNHLIAVGPHFDQTNGILDLWESATVQISTPPPKQRAGASFSQAGSPGVRGARWCRERKVTGLPPEPKAPLQPRTRVCEPGFIWKMVAWRCSPNPL